MKRKLLLIKIIFFCFFIFSSTKTQSQIKNTIADQAFSAYDAAFLVKSGELTYYKEALNKNTKDYFWMQALDIQTAQDVYFRTNDPNVSTEITNLLNTFLVQNSGNGNAKSWEWNEYNDDLFWAVLAFARGYEYTKNPAFLDQAKYGFILAFYHADNGGWGWDSQLGGGIWWSKMKEDKNALSNSPGVISACYLYEFTKNTTYLNLAKLTYEWERSHIWNSTTGEVWSAVLADGSLNKGLAVFNNGAFGGAANFLYQITGEKKYFDDAKLTFDRVISNMTSGGLLAAGTRNGTDLAEYIRYLSDFVRQNYLWNEYYTFLKRSADASWKIRRTDLNLAWNDFTKQTPVDNLTSVIECNSSVVLQQVTPVLSRLSGTIEAENYNYMSGIQVQSNNEAYGGKIVGSMETNDYLEYIVNVPTSGIYTLTLKTAGTVEGSVVIQQNGRTIKTLNIPTTANLQTYSDLTSTLNLTSGIQSIKLLAITGGWNIDNWSATLQTVAKPGKIQAEAYTSMSGVSTESTIDLNGGANVGFIDTGDWMEYTIDVPVTGMYDISYRVSGNGTGTVTLLQNGTELTTTALPNTGDWQNWTSVSTKVNLTEGAQTIKLLANTGGWNFNWWSAVLSDTSTDIHEILSSAEFKIYPNPVESILNIEFTNLQINELSVIDFMGRIIFTKTGKIDDKTSIDVSNLKNGIYILSIQTVDNKKIIKRFVK